MSVNRFRIVLIFLLSIFVVNNISAEIGIFDSAGTIIGRISDVETKLPIARVSILISGTHSGTISDSTGKFAINNLSVGFYSLHFSHIGYENQTGRAVSVGSNDTTFVQIELKPTAIRSRDINVISSRFLLKNNQPVSVASLTGMEIVRSADATGDVTRAISSLPSVSRNDDRYNNLIVRGGNHLENGWLLDNFEISSVDHYASLSGGGGAICLVNPALIENLNFYTGGFPAEFGDRLSSIIDIKLREGNREKIEGSTEVSLINLGAVLEGPLGNSRGSWLLSGRRGLMDKILDIANIDLAPNYYDIYGKLVYDLSTNNKITIMGLYSGSDINIAEKNAGEISGNAYGLVDATATNIGINWQYIRSSSHLSEFSLAYERTVSNYETYWLPSHDLQQEYELLQNNLTIRNENRIRFSKLLGLDFGWSLKYIQPDFDYIIEGRNIDYYYHFPDLLVDFNETLRKTAAYGSLLIRPFERLRMTAGVRADYFSFNHNFHVSPRFSFALKLGENSSLNGATGIYYQTIPLLILSQHDEYRKLKDQRAHHFVLGLNHRFSKDATLSIEIYKKEYYDIPVDTLGLPFFSLDELLELYDPISNYTGLVSEGRAFSQGIELTLKKEMSNKISWLVGGSYFVAQYKSFDDFWRNRVTDNRVTFIFKGGYKFNRNNFFNISWNFAGGTPYTPVDIELSKLLYTNIPDTSRINGARLPDYHSLSIRFDRYFHFSGSSLNLYFSIWNLYNRKNVAMYYWKVKDSKEVFIYQLSVLPIVGLKYEF